MRPRGISLAQVQEGPQWPFLRQEISCARFFHGRQCASTPDGVKRLCYRDTTGRGDVRNSTLGAVTLGTEREGYYVHMARTLQKQAPRSWQMAACVGTASGAMNPTGRRSYTTSERAWIAAGSSTLSAPLRWKLHFCRRGLCMIRTLQVSLS